MSRSTGPRPRRRFRPPDGGALFGRQRLEEQAEHVPAVPVVRLYRPMPFVVDDHGDARVAFAVAGLRPRRSTRGSPNGDGIDAFNRSATLMGGVFRRRATRRAENRLRSSGSRRSSATRVPIRGRVWTGNPPGSAHGTEATTTPHAAALVMPAAPPSASGASEHTRTRTHPDLEHGSGTRRRIRDPRILCNRAFRR